MNIIKLCGNLNYRISNIKICDSFPIGLVYNKVLHCDFQRRLFIDSYTKEVYSIKGKILQNILQDKTKDKKYDIYLKDISSAIPITLIKALYFFDSLRPMLNNSTVHTLTDKIRRQDFLSTREMTTFREVYNKRLMASYEYALVLQLILQDVGYESYMVCGSIQEQDKKDAIRHAWIEIAQGNVVYLLDPFSPCQYITANGKEADFTPIRKILSMKPEDLITATTDRDTPSVTYTAKSVYDTKEITYGVLQSRTFE